MKRVGAYGFAIDGLDADDWLVEAPERWPTISVSQVEGTFTGESSVGERQATLELVGGGSLHLVREARSVRFMTPTILSDAALIHPYLAPAMTVMASWEGWLTFHAGAFVLGSKAWILSADRGVGKSTTLASMAMNGYPVLGDDLVVVRDGVALAGPRSVDLREQGDFDRASDLGRIGERERWRLKLDRVESEVPVGGMIVLKWGERHSVAKVPVAERAPLVAPEMGLPPPQASILEILAYPTAEVTRPRGPLSETVQLLEDAVDALTN